MQVPKVKVRSEVELLLSSLRIRPRGNLEEACHEALKQISAMSNRVQGINPNRSAPIRESCSEDQLFGSRKTLIEGHWKCMKKIHWNEF